MKFSNHPSSTSSSKYKSVVQGLKDIYHNKIRPLEEHYNFEGFYSPPLSDAELDAKPIVLLLGQYSTGKTTFITKLLGGQYPGAHIGPEPTTDRFFAVMHGPDERIIPGNAAAVQLDKPFKTLSQFGSSFLSKFEISLSPIPLLESITFIDSPGVLSGEKQRLGRSYDFVRVCEWFAQKADIILLLFDAHKLDISDEFKRVISGLRGQDDKIRVLLNKADMITNQQLMRVYGALMWSLGKVIHTPEVMRVYIGSYWNSDSAHPDNKALIEAEMRDLLEDLKSLPRSSAIRKINDLVKRCRLARAHAYLISTIKKEMPAVFGKTSKQASLLQNLPALFTRIHKTTNLPMGDFPDIEKFTECLKEYDFDTFNKLNPKLMAKLDQAMCEDLPSLMQDFPQEPIIRAPVVVNPFDPTAISYSEESKGGVSLIGAKGMLPTFTPNGLYITLKESEIPWAISPEEMDRYEKLFYSIGPKNDKISGNISRSVLFESKLPVEDLMAIWNLADTGRDGCLDLYEFMVVMKLIDVRLSSGPIPTSLPAALTKAPVA